LFILSQYLLPHHLLSRLAGCIAECRVRWFKNAFTPGSPSAIRWTCPRRWSKT
jgi:hypothetical protein